MVILFTTETFDIKLFIFIFYDHDSLKRPPRRTSLALMSASSLPFSKTSPSCLVTQQVMIMLAILVPKQ